MILLAILFLVTAVLYSSVGFGGGSTYLALLLIWETPYFIFPLIALTCNIIVVSGNCYNYIRAGNLNFKLFFFKSRKQLNKITRFMIDIKLIFQYSIPCIGHATRRTRQSKYVFTICKYSASS